MRHDTDSGEIERLLVRKNAEDLVTQIEEALVLKHLFDAEMVAT
jgi:hypothetical protein